MSKNLIKTVALLLLSLPLLAQEALVAGTSADYPPIVFQDGEIVRGAEADLSTLVSQQLGRPIVFKQMNFEALIPALKSGEIDLIISGMSITPARQQELAFTTPIMQVGQMAIIRTADIMKLNQPRNLYKDGIRIGYKNGTTGEALVKEKAKLAKSQGFADVDAGLVALEQGEIDCFVHDAPTSWELSRPGSPYKNLISLHRPLTTEYLAWAVPKDQPRLLNSLDQALYELKQSGVLEQVLNHWLPVKIEVN